MNPNQLRWSALKVGFVVLIGLIIFVFIVSIVGTEQNIFTSNYTLKLFMPNVRGLVNGGMVTLGGLKVGYVTEMQFTTRDGVNGVDVSMKITSQHRRSITTTSVASIKTIGLLGDKYVDISIGSQKEEPLAEGAFIPLQETFDLDAAGPMFKTALNDFAEVLKNAKRITASIDKGEGSVGRLLKDRTAADELERFLRSLNAVTAALESRQGAAGQLIFDGQLSKDIGDVSANLKTVTDQLRQGKGTAGKLLMDDRLYTNLASFSARADSLMAKAGADSSNVSKLIGDPEFYRKVSDLMRDLNLLLIDLREHPGRYIRVSVF